MPTPPPAVTARARPVTLGAVTVTAPPELALSLRVLGDPIGQGAVRGGGTDRDATGKVTRRRQAYHANGKTLQPWRTAVQLDAQVAMARHRWARIAKPHGAELAATFYLPRPKTVTRPLPTVGGGSTNTYDLSHLVRAVEDALTKAGVWEDDSQVVTYSRLSKAYATAEQPAGVLLTVRRVPA